VKDKHYHSIDEVIAEIKGKSIEELRNEPWEGPHLISRDELLAAGALDVPPSWRKSLGGKERDLFSDLSGDDEDSEKKKSVSDQKKSKKSKKSVSDQS